MSSDLSIDASSPVPPFEQLRAQIASQAASGELPAGTKLATVRALAATWASPRTPSLVPTASSRRTA